MLVKHFSLTFFDRITIINSHKTWHLLGLASVRWHAIASLAILVLVLVGFVI